MGVFVFGSAPAIIAHANIPFVMFVCILLGGGDAANVSYMGVVAAQLQCADHYKS